MKIAIFVHCFFPGHFYGTETYTLDLAKNYRAMGVDVHVVTAIFAGEPPAKELITHYEYHGIPVTCIDKNRLPNTRVKDTYYQPDMRPVLEQVLRDIQPDVVHVTHLINHTAALLEVTRTLGIPSYATFTDFFGFCFNNKLEAADGSLCAGPSANRSNCMACYIKEAGRNPQTPRLVRWGTRLGQAIRVAEVANKIRKLPPWRGGPVDGLLEDLSRRPDTLLSLYSGYIKAVAPTKFLHKAYERNGFEISMRNIPFGVDIDRKAKPARAAGHTPVIGFIGQIAPHKGTDLLIEAFRRIPKGAGVLHIYGPSNQSPFYMNNLREMATGHDVHFKDTFEKEKMQGVLESLDLLVIPSRWYENSPLVLLNALATHTPVLVSDVEGMTEFVEDGVNGASFQRGSVDDMEEKLRTLLKDPERLPALSRTTSYERTTEMMAQETFKLYSGLKTSNRLSIKALPDTSNEENKTVRGVEQTAKNLASSAPFRLILHVGAGKTGSSSIQETLRINHELLKARGIWYLGMMFEHSPVKRYPWQIPSGFEALVKLKNDEITDQLVDVLESTLSEIKLRGGHTAILSNESLFHHHREPLFKAIEILHDKGWEIEAVAYVRRQDAWAKSAYIQWGLKHKIFEGELLPFAQWSNQLSDRYSQFSQNLHAWMQFEWLKCHVRNADYVGDVVKDFFTLLGLTLDEFSVQRANMQPCSEELLLRALFNSMFSGSVPPERFDRLLGAKDINYKCSASTFLNACLPTQEDLNKYQENNAADIEEVNRILEKSGQPRLDITPKNLSSSEADLGKVVAALFAMLVYQAQRVEHIESKMRNFQRHPQEWLPKLIRNPGRIGVALKTKIKEIFR